MEFRRVLFRSHAKLIVADDITYIGSSNFDVRSLYLNMELMLRVDDPAFAGEIRSSIAEDIAVSERIDRARYRQMSNWWRQLKTTIAYFIVAILDFNVELRPNLCNHRSEERRVGKECVSSLRSWGPPT